MDELFRWTLGTAFAVSLVTAILTLLGGRLWLQWVLMLVITIFALVRAMQKYGVPDSAFRSGGVILLASLAGFLIGSATQEILDYVVNVVLFIAVYFIGGFIAGRIQPAPKDEEREDWPPKGGGEQMNEIPENMREEPPEAEEVGEKQVSRRRTRPDED